MIRRKTDKKINATNPTYYSNLCWFLKRWIQKCNLIYTSWYLIVVLWSFYIQYHFYFNIYFTKIACYLFSLWNNKIVLSKSLCVVSNSCIYWLWLVYSVVNNICAIPNFAETCTEMSAMESQAFATPWNPPRALNCCATYAKWSLKVCALCSQPYNNVSIEFPVVCTKFLCYLTIITIIRGLTVSSYNDANALMLCNYAKPHYSLTYYWIYFWGNMQFINLGLVACTTSVCGWDSKRNKSLKIIGFGCNVDEYDCIRGSRGRKWNLDLFGSFLTSAGDNQCVRCRLYYMCSRRESADSVIVSDTIVSPHFLLNHHTTLGVKYSDKQKQSCQPAFL